MKVLFSPAYQLELDPKQAHNLEPYPPLGTLYAASTLRRAGHEVVLSDSMLATGHREFVTDLKAHQPDLVAIYEDDFNYLSKMCLTNVREAALEKARLARERGALVVVHGSDATDRVEEYLRGSVDFAIVGEGEQTMDALVRTLEEGAASQRHRLRSVDGLAYLDDRGKLVRTAPRAVLKNLDELELPAWELVDVDRYRRAWMERHDHFSINMVTTRGCPYHCNWCAKPIYGQRYNVRSPASVAGELAWLRENVAPDHIWFADDIFGLKPGWIASFAGEVEARGVVTPYKVQARVDLIDDGVARALARSGCESVWVGAESGSQRILDAMDKGTTVEEIFEATTLLRRHGIRVGYFLQFGYPGEEWSDISRTREMVRKARPDDIGISVSYPLPGTPFHDRVASELSEKRNWTDSDDLDLMFPGTYPPELYRALYRLVHAEVRIQRALRSWIRPESWTAAVVNAVRWVAARLSILRQARRRNPVLL